MSLTEDIRSYLADNTDTPESQLDELAHVIEARIDYSPIYGQIDELLKQLAYWQDYDRTLPR